MGKGNIETSKTILRVKIKKKQNQAISKESWKVMDKRKQFKHHIYNSRSKRLKETLSTKYSRIDREVKSHTRSDWRYRTEGLISKA